MNIFDYQKHTQDTVLEELQKADIKNPDWYKRILEFKPEMVIWFLKELVEKGEHVEKIFVLTKVYLESDDPLPDDENINERIKRGEEIRNIYTVRGTACWLLSSIAGTLRTEFYSEIVSILEKMAFDLVYYVRIQTTVPLSFFAANIRARKNKDGTDFDFKDKDRDKIVALSVRMLKEHRDLPRVLEGVINIFDSLRSSDKFNAKEIIEYLSYNSKKEIQPNYITQKVVPLLIFYAEYYNVDFNKDFDEKWFQEFAINLLKLPEAEAPYLRSTFVWYTWKELQNNPDNFLRLKKYIPFFLRQENFELESIHQYEFLVREVIKISPKDGLDLFNKQLNFVTKWAHKYNIQNHSPWLLDVKEIVERVAGYSPNDYLKILNQVADLVLKRVYVGGVVDIFRAYKLIIDPKKQEEIKSEVLELYSKVRQLDQIEKFPEDL